MRYVNSLDELDLPNSHKQYLIQLLGYLKMFPKVEKVILFGSCAKGNATGKSDIDLLFLARVSQLA